MKLALGTAQFGFDYGLANSSGPVKLEEIKKILDVASSSGIEMLDTAIAYGNSESIIGDLNRSRFEVTTKLPPLPKSVKNIDLWVNEQLQGSLKRLQARELYGVLLHRPEDLAGKFGEALLATLKDLRSQKIVKKIGISIYKPNELELLTKINDVDIVQVPLNLIDRRIVSSGWLDRLYENGVEVHTRSSFLQGLLLMPRTDMPQKFNKWKNIWDKWDAIKTEHLLLDPITTCLQYPVSLKQVSKVIVGVDSAEHFEKIINSLAKSDQNPLNLDCLVSEDEELIIPSNWNSY
jgi:aryl-alcohol dehydrogenase-like predicted oxidoreductase